MNRIRELGSRAASDEAQAEAILEQGASWLLVATWVFFISLTFSFSG